MRYAMKKRKRGSDGTGVRAFFKYQGGPNGHPDATYRLSYSGGFLNDEAAGRLAAGPLPPG
jgi:hypothetical protein